MKINVLGFCPSFEMGKAFQCFLDELLGEIAVIHFGHHSILHFFQCQVGVGELSELIAEYTIFFAF